jgi:hypothetical protein
MAYRAVLCYTGPPAQPPNILIQFGILHHEELCNLYRSPRYCLASEV